MSDERGLLDFRPADGIHLVGLPDSALIYREIWEDHVYDRGRPIAAGARVVDLGANQGFFSVYAASKGARVWAYEPEPRAFEILGRNVEACGLRAAVDAHTVAVGSAAGEIDLVVPSRSTHRVRVSEEGPVAVRASSRATASR